MGVGTFALGLIMLFIKSQLKIALLRIFRNDAKDARDVTEIDAA